jgi:hypothetical protein
MADLSFSVSALVSKGAFSQSFNAANMTADISSAGMIALTLNLNTATTEISTATMSSLGLCYARNLSTATTHTVSFGRLNGTTLYESVRLRAGEAAMFRMAAGSYAAKAAVAGSRLLINVIED